jgi:hypothetical protein
LHVCCQQLFQETLGPSVSNRLIFDQKPAKNASIASDAQAVFSRKLRTIRVRSAARRWSHGEGWIGALMDWWIDGTENWNDGMME